jgi:hypothetical protein
MPGAAVQFMLSEYASKVTPKPPDRTLVASRRAEMEDALDDDSVLRNAFVNESGSFRHGTSVRAHSDVDYLVWTTRPRPTRPSTQLSSLKSHLYINMYSATAASVRNPTVRVEFATAPFFEVVPAWWSHDVGDDEVFYIPGPGDEWVKSIPKAHNRYVSEINDRHKKKVKQLVRLLKAWKYHVGAPVSSFYLEIRTARYAAGETSILYLLDLKIVMSKILNEGVRDLNDPLHIVGRIPGCPSEAKRLTTKRLLSDAVTALDRAWDAYKDNDKTGYWLAMTDVFGTDFPWPTE